MQQRQSNPAALLGAVIVALFGLAFTIYSLFIISGHPRAKHTILGIAILVVGLAAVTYLRPRRATA